MSGSEDEDETLANFLESEILSGFSPSSPDHEQPDPPPLKKPRHKEEKDCGCSSFYPVWKVETKFTHTQIETGTFSKVPPELFHHILKFLSSEDLIACSMVCKYLSFAASDECLWHRLYCMRWGLASPTKKLRESAWKKLYIQRDQEDMVEFVRNTPSEFKEYYIQMQAAKRSQAPLPSQVNDDSIILDKTVSDQVSMWKASRGLTDDVVADHACSGDTCSYYQIGDVFLCEKTGRVHVCGDICREAVMDAPTGLWVCTISGQCFDNMLSPAETEPDDFTSDLVNEPAKLGVEEDCEVKQEKCRRCICLWCCCFHCRKEQQVGVTDEAEPFMGSGRFARAYLLGYNCEDEKELESALRFC